jgi:hypothetical protein
MDGTTILKLDFKPNSNETKEVVVTTDLKLKLKPSPNKTKAMLTIAGRCLLLRCSEQAVERTVAQRCNSRPIRVRVALSELKYLKQDSRCPRLLKFPNLASKLVAKLPTNPIRTNPIRTSSSALLLIIVSNKFELEAVKVVEVKTIKLLITKQTSRLIETVNRQQLKLDQWTLPEMDNPLIPTEKEFFKIKISKNNSNKTNSNKTNSNKTKNKTNSQKTNNNYLWCLHGCRHGFRHNNKTKSTSSKTNLCSCLPSSCCKLSSTCFACRKALLALLLMLVMLMWVLLLTSQQTPLALCYNPFINHTIGACSPTLVVQLLSLNDLCYVPILPSFKKRCSDRGLNKQLRSLQSKHLLLSRCFLSNRQCKPLFCPTSSSTLSTGTETRPVVLFRRPRSPPRVS